VVKALRASTFNRLFIVAIMLLSWLVITNHCALGLMTRGGPAHAHCHAAKSDHGGNSPGDRMQECCRAIKASLAGQMEFKAHVTQWELLTCVIIQWVPSPMIKPGQAIFLDHGPPRAVSFAEIVLQRSLLSHAPPTLA
jgi:hypothetical protein